MPVALVTGGGRGIGRAIALRLAAERWDVAIAARSADQLAETARLAGGRTLAIPADIADPAAVNGIVRQTETQLGPIDLLVNNAGVAGPLEPFSETDPAVWWRCQEVNLRGPMLCCRAVLPGMIERRSGRIVNMASGLGCHAEADMSAYVVSKTALIRFTEQLAAELDGSGVTIFAIRPGLLLTAMVEDVRQRIPRIQKLVDEGREVPVEAVADLVLKLASGRADALSGRLISPVDDFEAMIRQAEAAREQELYLLRLRRP